MSDVEMPTPGTMEFEEYVRNKAGALAEVTGLHFPENILAEQPFLCLIMVMENMLDRIKRLEHLEGVDIHGSDIN